MDLDHETNAAIVNLGGELSELRKRRSRSTSNGMVIWHDETAIDRWRQSSDHLIHLRSVIERQQARIAELEATVGYTDSATDSPWYPDDSGQWVEWRGGKCPVPGNDQVVWLRRSEREDRHYDDDPPLRASALYWLHIQDENDIVAYKVVKPASIEDIDPEEWTDHIVREVVKLRLANEASQ